MFSSLAYQILQGNLLISVYSCRIKDALEQGLLAIPRERDGIPFHFVGDEIFPLSPNLMKPYPSAGAWGLQQ